MQGHAYVCIIPVNNTYLMNIAIQISFVLIIVAQFLAILRLIIGPGLINRVIALDLLAFLTISFVGVYTISTGEVLFLDIAIVLALVAFLSTIAFARYIIRSIHLSKLLKNRN